MEFEASRSGIKGNPRHTRSLVLVEEALREFLFWAQAEVALAANTRAAYESDLARYRAFLLAKKVRWKRIRPEHVLAFLAGLQARGLLRDTP